MHIIMRINGNSTQITNNIYINNENKTNRNNSLNIKANKTALSKIGNNSSGEDSYINRLIKQKQDMENRLAKLKESQQERIQNLNDRMSEVKDNIKEVATELNELIKSNDNTKKSSVSSQDDDNTKKSSISSQDDDNTKKSSISSQDDDNTKKSSVSSQGDDNTKKSSILSKDDDNTKKSSILSKDDDNTKKSSISSQGDDNTKNSSILSKDDDNTKKSSVSSKDDEDTRNGGISSKDDKDTEINSILTKYSASKDELPSEDDIASFIAKQPKDVGELYRISFDLRKEFLKLGEELKAYKKQSQQEIDKMKNDIENLNTKISNQKKDQFTNGNDKEKASKNTTEKNIISAYA